MTDTRPNLFLVGAPKCGTTSLHGYLSQHPDIFMSQNKEPHYFGQDVSLAFSVRDIDRYMSLFDEGKGCIYRGESSTWSLYSATAAAEIREFAPDARIVVMLRHPADFVASLHLQALNSGGEDILNLEDALEAEVDRAEGRRMPPHCIWPTLQYRKVARFSSQVQRYIDAFGRNRVMIGLQEDMRNDLQGFIEKLHKFLGVTPIPLSDTSWQNKSRNLSRVDLLVKNAWWRSPLFRKIVRRSPSGARQAYRFITSRLLPSVRKNTFDPALRERLTCEFRDEILHLQSLLDRDLSHWLKI